MRPWPWKKLVRITRRVRENNRPKWLMKYSRMSNYCLELLIELGRSSMRSQCYRFFPSPPIITSNDRKYRNYWGHKSMKKQQILLKVLRSMWKYFFLERQNFSKQNKTAKILARLNFHPSTTIIYSDADRSFAWIFKCMPAEFEEEFNMIFMHTHLGFGEKVLFALFMKIYWAMQTLFRLLSY